MDIREKALLGIITIILVFLIVLIGVSSSFMLANYQELETSETAWNIDLVIGKLDAQLTSLSSLAKSWAESDAIYSYAQGESPGFIRQTLPPNTFRRYDINAIIITDREGTILYSQGYDFITGITEPVPASVTAALSQPQSPHMNLMADGYSGFIDVPEKGGPAFFVSAPILHSNHTGPPAGILIIGKYIYADELDLYRSNIIPSLSIASVRPGNRVSHGTGGELTSLTRSPVTVTVINETTLGAEARIRDHFGEEKIRLAIEMPRNIALQGKNALLGAILVELATGLVLGLFIILLLDQLVLTRLQKFSADIGTIARTGDVSARMKVTSNDEISRLGEAVNLMLSCIEDAKSQFAESEKKLNRAERVAKFGHWEFDMETKKVTTSAGARMIYGIGEREYTIPEIQTIPLPAYREYLDRALSDLVGKNKPYMVEFAIRRPLDNAVLSIRSIAEYDPARNVVFGVIQDVTNQKEVELALRESEERYRSLTDNLPELVLVHRNGIFIYANEALSSAVGIPAAGLIGRSIFEFVAPESRAIVIEQSRLRTQGVEVEPLEAVFIGKNNEKHHGLLNAARIMYGGEPAYLVIITDISARKAMEEALATANRKLHMLSSITRHDIRNKILGLRSYIAIATMSAHDDAGKRILQQMEDEARTIDEQIEFTREYQTMGVYVPQWLPVGDIVSRVSSQLNLKAIRLTDESNGLEIYADPLLEKVFYNLFDNAIRYGETITEIRIRFERPGDLLTVIVEDDGVGIPAEDKMEIFERGFGKNTGLGLFMIREILSITGITIRESGVHGRGARFELLVPKGGFRFVGSGGNGRQ